MRKFLAALLITVSVSTFAAEPAAPDKTGFKWGIGFSHLTSGYGVALDLVTPRFMNFGASSLGGNRPWGISAFLQLDLDTILNQATAAGVFTQTYATHITAGVRRQWVNQAGIFPYYAMLGLDVMLLPTTLSATPVSLGLFVAPGVDFTILRSEDGGAETSFFVQADIRFFHRKADAITGTPDLFNGVTPRIGIRSHW